jgi:hypothetical protein
MDTTTYNNRSAINAALLRVKQEFNEQELAALQPAVESLSRHALVTLKELAPSSEPDDTWVPITDIIDGDDRPDDMTAVSASANELQELGLVEIEPPSAGNAARIDVLRFRATDLGRRFANAAL